MCALQHLHILQGISISQSINYFWVQKEKAASYFAHTSIKLLFLPLFPQISAVYCRENDDIY